MVSVKEATVSRLQLSVERMLRERDTATRNHLAEKKTLTEERVREREREGGSHFLLNPWCSKHEGLLYVSSVKRVIFNPVQTKYRELAEERERVLAADVKETEQLKEELSALKRHLKLVEVCSLLTN